MAEIDGCDVCVVGTGAAGGILAHSLAMAGLKVVSLEQGPRLAANYFRSADPYGSRKDFGIRAHTSWPADPHEAFFGNALFASAEHGSARRRAGGFLPYQVFAVGGLQNLWNGVSVRFSADDVRGWPLPYDDLARHYAATERLVTVCGTSANLPELPDGEFIAPKPFRPVDDLLAKAVASLGAPTAHVTANRKAINTRPGTPSSCQSTGGCAFGCPTDAVYKFSSRLLPRIAGRSNYSLRPEAKVTRLIASPDGARVESVEFLDTASGERHRLRAGIVVLAAGALESPRILFNSASGTAPAGLANRYDQVGRRLQDNPKTVLSTSLWKLWGKRRDYDIGYGDPVLIVGRASLPDGETFPFLCHNSHSVPDIPHYLAGLKRFPPFVKRRLARLMFHSYLTIGMFCGGEPNPANRLRPSRETDAFGVPQVDIDYTSSPRAQARMDAMERWGRRVLGRASGTIIHGGSSDNGTGIHYAGTTGMAADPCAGVVDANLRCHGIANLYVCDGGVIPQLPEKHLTLTIMALAHRLGDHLAARAAAGELSAA
ncbi:GMC oxidoreductase [Ancylobacter rudongensis]|uniref:Choline dehydrogenase n=1 Tax=Ancylobacter rudongensis TaxID=177413 RepID=A0A1G4T070_9HYPH|nr:GMC family oxidoreductase [Ancylobacter rudongensis]SCW74215.1 Choline dehydrogenase [Ancylobacter rudongensis]